MASMDEHAKLWRDQTLLLCDGRNVYGPCVIHPLQTQHWRLEWTSSIRDGYRYLTSFSMFATNPDDWWTMHKKRCEDDRDTERMDAESLSGGNT